MTLVQLANSKFYHEALGDFPESAFLKFLVHDPIVGRRYYQRELPHDVLEELYRVLGATPRFVEQVRKVLRTITADDLQAALTAVELPAETDAGALREARDRYCEQIF